MLSQAKIGVCKTCISHNFGDFVAILWRFAAICYKYIGCISSLYKLPQITANCHKLLKSQLKPVKQTLIFGCDNMPKKNPNIEAFDIGAFNTEAFRLNTFNIAFIVCNYRLY